MTPFRSPEFSITPEQAAREEESNADMAAQIEAREKGLPFQRPEQSKNEIMREEILAKEKQMQPQREAESNANMVAQIEARRQSAPMMAQIREREEEQQERVMDELRNIGKESEVTTAPAEETEGSENAATPEKVIPPTAEGGNWKGLKPEDIMNYNGPDLAKQDLESGMFGNEEAASESRRVAAENAPEAPKAAQSEKAQEDDPLKRLNQYKF